jgi:hypothetical protein
MFPSGFKITTDMLWRSTLVLAGIDAILLPFVAWGIKPDTFRRFRWALVIIAGFFWGLLWDWVLANFWESVYVYVFPAWARWMIPPLYGLLFAGVSLSLWWLALKFGGNPVVNFCLMGGLWGMLTHILAVFLGIVDKPPVLQGAAPEAAVIVAIFEFMVYWSVILIASALVHRGWRKVRKETIGKWQGGKYA